MRLWSKGYLWRTAAVVTAAALATACGAAADPMLPTVRPTFTPTLEASVTPTPTLIPTRTPTPTLDALAESFSPTPLVGEMPTRPRYTLTPTVQGIIPGS